MYIQGEQVGRPETSATRHCNISTAAKTWNQDTCQSRTDAKIIMKYYSAFKKLAICDRKENLYATIL